MRPSINRRAWKKAVFACLVGLALLAPSGAITMDDLRNDAKLNPYRFAYRLSDFTFEFFPYVQDPNVFLSTRNGCCQDYAILGSYVLNQHNYTTRLIRVVLVGGEAHDVCYVTQSKGYLDYNLRASGSPVQKSGRTLREIATKVSASFKEDWTSASEFTYTYAEDVKRLTLTVVKTDPPSEDPDLKERP